MKQMKKILVFALSVLFGLTAEAQGSWDAVSAKEAVTMVAGGGYDINNVMARNGYTLVNNVSTPDGGFVTIYSRNCTVNSYGDATRLGQGVSSIVLCTNPIDQPSDLSVMLFSAANATKFRQQILDLGFKKSGTVRGNTVYKIPNVDFAIQEGKGKSGRYPVTIFYFSQQLP